MQILFLLLNFGPLRHKFFLLRILINFLDVFHIVTHGVLLLLNIRLEYILLQLDDLLLFLVFILDLF